VQTHEDFEKTFKGWGKPTLGYNNSIYEVRSTIILEILSLFLM
jgi:hypothetical protein